MNHGTIKIYAARIVDIEESVYQKLLERADEETREQAGRFHFRKDALRTLIGTLLMRYTLKKDFGYDNSMPVIKKNQFGKPYLEAFSDFYYNISHSGDWVVCGADYMEIGLDIEKIGAIELSLAKRFFSEEEYQFILSKRAEEQTSVFYDFWTLKESYIKHQGKGLTIPLDSFSFILRDGEIILKNDGGPQLFFRQYGLDPGYQLSVCASEDRFPEAVKQVGIEELIG